MWRQSMQGAWGEANMLDSQDYQRGIAEGRGQALCAVKFMQILGRRVAFVGYDTTDSPSANFTCMSCTSYDLAPYKTLVAMEWTFVPLPHVNGIRYGVWACFLPLRSSPAPPSLLWVWLLLLRLLCCRHLSVSNPSAS
jgi:hypothetical protein